MNRPREQEPGHPVCGGDELPLGSMLACLTVVMTLGLGGCAGQSPLAPRSADGVFPGSTFGFDFGQTLADAERVCASIGHQWSRTVAARNGRVTAHCVGDTAGATPQGNVQLVGCGASDTVCAIAWGAYVDGQHVSASFADATTDLGDRFGTAADQSRGEQACILSAVNEDLWGGVAAGLCDITRRWSVEGGTVTLRVGASARGGRLLLTIAYVGVSGPPTGAEFDGEPDPESAPSPSVP